MSGSVVIEQTGGVVELRLDRTEKKNALTAAMYDALSEALERGGGDPSVRAFLISAAGDTFTAGNDIGDFLRAADQSDGAGGSAAWRFILALTGCAKPVVAAVQGQAVGIGTTMLLHCDLVYASPEALLSVPFVSLGLVPEAGSSLLMPQRLGPQRAARMLLLGEAMTAEQALAAGLITEIVPPDRLREHAAGKAARLATQPPQALAAARALMAPDPGLLAAHMQREMAAFVDAVRGAEAREALTAFMEKRRPDFSSLPG